MQALHYPAAAEGFLQALEHPIKGHVPEPVFNTSIQRCNRYSISLLYFFQSVYTKSFLHLDFADNSAQI